MSWARRNRRRADQRRTAVASTRSGLEQGRWRDHASVLMRVEDLREQVRAELAAVDPSLAADPIAVDRQVREVAAFLLSSAEDQVNAAIQKAGTSPGPHDRDLWLRRAERLRQGALALQAALDELGSASVGSDLSPSGPGPITELAHAGPCCPKTTRSSGRILRTSRSRPRVTQSPARQPGVPRPPGPEPSREGRLWRPFT